MLSLAGHKIGSARSGGRKIHCKIGIETEARRQRQARQQRETASDWLDAALSKLRRRDGKKRPPDVRSRGRIKRIRGQKHRYGSCYFFHRMRQVKLTGREASVVRAIGFTESMLGAEIQDFVRMESEDRKSTRLNSSHTVISYAVFCLKKKKATATFRMSF